MNRLKIKNIFLALFISCFSYFHGDTWANSGHDKLSDDRLLVSDVDLGVVYSHSIKEIDVIVRNNSDKRLDIAKIVASTSRSEKRSTPVTVGAKGEARYPLEIDIGRRVGRFSIGFDIYLVDKVEPTSKFIVRGFADWLVDPASMKADVGIVAADKPTRLEIFPITRPGAEVQLKKVNAADGVIEVELSPAGKSAIVSTKKSTRWGAFDEAVDISTDSTLQPMVTMEIKGEVRGQVVPSVSVVSFGLIREGQSAEQIVRLSDSSGSAIRVGKISSRGADVSIKDEECIPTERGCRLLRLSPWNLKAGTAMHGEVAIELPDYSSILSLAINGFVIGKDEQIGDLNGDRKSIKSEEPPISKLLKSAAAKPIEMNVPSGDGPLLTWRVTGNSAIYGFEIYRGLSSDGSFLRVSQPFIYPISVNAEVGAIYRWRDQTAASGTAYWYYIGVIFNDGRRQVLTGAQKIIAK